MIAGNAGRNVASRRETNQRRPLRRRRSMIWKTTFRSTARKDATPPDLRKMKGVTSLAGAVAVVAVGVVAIAKRERAKPDGSKNRMARTTNSAASSLFAMSTIKRVMKGNRRRPRQTIDCPKRTATVSSAKEKTNPAVVDVADVADGAAVTATVIVHLPIRNHEWTASRRSKTTMSSTSTKKASPASAFAPKALPTISRKDTKTKGAKRPTLCIAAFPLGKRQSV
jgi:hypothetical protein